MRATTTNSKVPSVQSSITAFTRIEKPNVSAVSQKDVTLSASKTTSKRKYAVLDSEDEDEEDDGVETATKRMKTTEDISVQIDGLPNPQSLPTPESTPSKPLKYMDCLQLQKSPLKKVQFSAELEKIAETPDSEDEADKDQEENAEEAMTTDELPIELQDLIRLQSSFIKALSIHYAHHGTTTPIRLSTFLPTISRLWSKRAVTVRDIQQCLGTMQQASTLKLTIRHSTSPPSLIFHLYDYGRSQLYLEMIEHASLASTLNLHTLIAPFATAIEQAWQTHQAPFPSHLSEANSDEISHFISTLPQLPIEPSPSLLSSGPPLSKGQRRLDSLTKPSASTPKDSPNTTSTLSTGLKKKSAVLTRSNSLLERLRAKEQASLTSPSAPSRTALARTAALQRLPAIVSILCMLRSSSTKQKQTFSLPALVQRVQDSCSSCMSREEVERCVVLLAEEVARGSGFVEMVRTEGLVVVVIEAGRMPVDLERRIEVALEGDAK